MGFSKKLTKSIEWYISIEKFFVLVNDISSGFFQSSRGLKQGDTLSLYLFVLAMEVFNYLLERARNGDFCWDLG